MRKKLISIGNNFTIKDDQQREVFQVDAAFFTIHSKLIFRDMQGKELASILKKLISIGHTYEIYHGDKLAATVKESMFTLLGHKFSVDDERGANDLEAKGSFMNHSYTFERAGKKVAECSESWFSLTDVFGVDIADGEDDVLILACTAVIDECTEKKGLEKLV